MTVFTQAVRDARRRRWVLVVNARRQARARRIRVPAVLLTVGAAAALPLLTLADRRPVAGVAAAAAAVGVLCGGYVKAAWNNQQLRRLLADAHRDPVTGLPNRVVAELALRAAAARGMTITVALADVDDLRVVNNTWGHAAGDRYLVAVADRLVEAVAGRAIVARHGGDEFLVLSDDLTPTELAVAIAAAMGRASMIDGEPVLPRTSVGIATSGRYGTHQAIACADAAMYTAKASGGNQVVTYDPWRDGIPEQGVIRPALRQRDRRPYTVRRHREQRRVPS